MNFSIVILRVHDNDQVGRDVRSPAKRTRGHHNLNGTYYTRKVCDEQYCPKRKLDLTDQHSLRML